VKPVAARTRQGGDALEGSSAPGLYSKPTAKLAVKIFLNYVDRAIIDPTVTPEEPPLLEELKPAAEKLFRNISKI